MTTSSNLTVNLVVLSQMPTLTCSFTDDSCAKTAPNFWMLKHLSSQLGLFHVVGVISLYFLIIYIYTKYIYIYITYIIYIYYRDVSRTFFFQQVFFGMISKSSKGKRFVAPEIRLSKFQGWTFCVTDFVLPCQWYWEHPKR